MKIIIGAKSAATQIHCTTIEEILIAPFPFLFDLERSVATYFKLFLKMYQEHLAQNKTKKTRTRSIWPKITIYHTTSHEH